MPYPPDLQAYAPGSPYEPMLPEPVAAIRGAAEAARNEARALYALARLASDDFAHAIEAAGDDLVGLTERIESAAPSAADDVSAALTAVRSAIQTLRSAL